MPETKEPRRPGSPPRPRRRVRLGRLILSLFVLVTLALLAIGAGFAAGALRNLPKIEGPMRPDMSAVIYDQKGNQVEELHAGQNRIPVTLDQVPATLQNAFLATEDIRFYQHYGVDFRGIARAVVTDVLHRGIRQGASTITQQLAENAFFGAQESSFKRKIQETVLALQLERTYSKEQILEQYLNWVYFGEGAYGVQAAAQTYFGKDVQQLDLGESALLAGLVKAPSRYSPFKNAEAANQRRALVLDNMARYGFISPEEAARAKAEPLRLGQKQDVQKHNYPYFVDLVTQEATDLLEANGIPQKALYNTGLRIYTTLDPIVQEKMEQMYADPKNFPAGAKDRLIESAMVVLDPHTGEIRGLMGGRDYKVQRGLNRAVQANRQPGSSIKPLAVYGPALEKGYTAATVLDDVPAEYPGGQPGQTYSPGNYDGKYRGLISMREAVRWSVNIYAVKMLNSIGVETGFDFAKRAGLPLRPDDKYLPLALGGIGGVSPLDMASAYGAFANQGIRVEPHAITRIDDNQGRTLVEVKPRKTVVMSPQTAYIMTDILQTVVKSGTGTQANLGNRPTAGKTGTTQLPDRLAAKNLKGENDAWFLGYTPELVGAVWMGYDQTDEQHYLRSVAGGGYPARLWKAVMSTALKDAPVQQFARPDGIVYAGIDPKSGLLPSDLTPFTTTEVFTRQTVPSETSTAWVQLQVCGTTGQLPNPYCPDVVTGIFLQRPSPRPPGVFSEDADLEAPQTTCTLHGPNGVQSALVNLCTDPRHKGLPVLARMPGPSESGGCPPEFMKQVAPQSGQWPTQFCDLPDHQVAVSTSGGIYDGGTGPPLPENTPPQPPPDKEAEQPAPVLNARPLPAVPGRKAAVELNWTLATEGSFQFSIERRQEGDGNRYNLAVVDSSPYIDRQVETGQTYYYRIFALPPRGEPLVSKEVQVTLAKP